MIIGIMLSGIVGGAAGVFWALTTGFSVFLALALYPLAGVAGVMLFLAIISLRNLAGASRHRPGMKPVSPLR